MKKYLLSLTTLFISFALPLIASAHEVYVLSGSEIAQAVAQPPFNMLDVVKNNLGQFTFWAFVSVLVVVFVFLISILRFLEKRIDPLLATIRPYASFIARVTVGLSFLAAGYFGASYGPELPLAAAYGSYAPAVSIVLYIIGVMTLLGLYARVAAVVALLMYSYAVYLHGSYMLTYVNYLGEIIVLLILGAHTWSIDGLHARKAKATKLMKWLAPKSFAILRIFFGISLIYASAYAKIIHNNLALDTVLDYHLDTIFGFEAHFLVLGAALIELVIGTFFILGIEIRFTSLFFLGFLSASLVFFGESVWPHIILIGIPIALIFYGYDTYSLEGYFFRKKKYEPIL